MLPWQAYTKTTPGVTLLLSSHHALIVSKAARARHVDGRFQRPHVHGLGAHERGVRGLQQGI